MAKNNKKSNEQNEQLASDNLISAPLKTKYQLEPIMATFDENGFCAEEGFVLVYKCDHISREYTGATYEFRSVGVGIPLDSYLDKPNPPNNECAIVRSENGWEYLPDFRGQDVYDVQDQRTQTVDYIGNIKEGFTLHAPSSEFDEFDGKKWIFSAQKQQEFLVREAQTKKQTLLDQAEHVIEDLMDLVETERATDAEKANLKLWRGFRSDIRRIKPENAPDITWTEMPSNLNE